MNRAMVHTMRLLDKQQQRPAEALAPPPPAIEPIPAPRRRPPEEKPAQHPVHREKALAAPPKKDPAKMTDAELEAAMNEMQALYDAALNDAEHPMHREALLIRPEDLPGGFLPVSPGSTGEAHHATVRQVRSAPV